MRPMAWVSTNDVAPSPTTAIAPPSTSMTTWTTARLIVATIPTVAARVTPLRVAAMATMVRAMNAAGTIVTGYRSGNPMHPDRSVANSHNGIRPERRDTRCPMALKPNPTMSVVDNMWPVTARESRAAPIMKLAATTRLGSTWVNPCDAFMNAPPTQNIAEPANTINMVKRGAMPVLDTSP